MRLERESQSLDALLQRGAALLEANQPDQAAALCEQGLQRYPSSAGLHHLASVCAIHMQRYEVAERHLRRAIELAPDQAQLHLNLGILLAQRQCVLEAEPCFRRALALNRRLPGAHYNLAVLLSRAGNVVEAERHYRQVLALEPGSADALYNLATLFGVQDRYEEAAACYRRLLASQPLRVDAWYNLAVLARRRKRYEEAQRCYSRILELQPGHYEACLGLAEAQLDGGCTQEAVESAKHAARLVPADATALCDLAALWARLESVDESERCYRRALQLDPGFARAHLGVAQGLEASNSAEAERHYRQALQHDPRSIHAWYNLGVLLGRQGRMAESEASYRGALQVDPGFASASRNLADILLRRGEFTEGWLHFESRYSPRRGQHAVPLPQAGFPQWRGEPLAGKSIIVLHEQGFGDQIQMCRYVPQLKQMGAAKVTLVCAPELYTLFATLPGVDQLALSDQAEARADYDYWSLLLSLPHCLSARLRGVPDRLPYLAVPPGCRAKWQDRLPRAPLRVGLAWKGSGLNPIDQARSLPGLETLAPLWSVPGVSYFSLQKAGGAEPLQALPPGQPLHDLGPELEDFADTAAVVEQLDLVICVDSVLAHLAGSLNRPCWVLMWPRPDWRWPDGRDDTPWYPKSMRLFRRGADEDWPAVVERVQAALLQHRSLGSSPCDTPPAGLQA